MAAGSKLHVFQQQLVGNPYSSAKTVVPRYTECELCDRSLLTKDWTTHKNSKAHRKLEAAERGPPAQYGGPVHEVEQDVAPEFAGGQRNGSEQACFKCGKKGHRKADCTNPPQRDDKDECFNCRLPGHRKEDCTNPKVDKCLNCDGLGHLRKECPEPKDWSRIKCRNCQNYGHTRIRCPEPVAEETGGEWSADTGAADNTRDWANNTNATDNAGGSSWNTDAAADEQWGDAANSSGW